MPKSLKNLFIKLFGQLLTLFLIIFTFPQIATAQALTWTKSSGIGSVSQEVRIAPSNSSVIYATLRGLNPALYKSIDVGVSFELKSSFVNDDVNSIAISSNNSEKLCIGAYFNGIYCGTDGGATLSNVGWLNSGLLGIKVRFVAADPTNDNIFYAGTGENNGDGGIYKTTDSGNTWIKVGSSTYGSQNCLNIVVDKSNHDRIFAGSDGALYRSLDAGINWTPLSLFSAIYPATLIDNPTPSVIYSGVYSSGVYKSIDNGDNWTAKNAGIENAFIFRLAQDNDNKLYGSRRNSPGSVWRSTDGGETWENVGDPSWGMANTWGLDAKGGRVIVSVEGLGIFFADTSPAPPPPPPGPNPVVIIPGFGGSWSTKAIVLHQPTDYHDWVMMPFKAPEIYNPFLNVLPSQKFFFAYDFTKSITETAHWLNDFLTNEVLPKNPGKKVDIVAHSMGGLLTRACFETVFGCKDKINKIVSAGTPHLGAVDDYNFWEGADFSNLDPLSKYGAKLFLHFDGFPKWDELKIIQEDFVGARDFMPIFDYIFGKPYSSLSAIAHNSVLALLNLSSDFKARTFTLSGNRADSTAATLFVDFANRKETASGYWPDGKPTKTILKGLGDGTVLNASSAIPDAAKNTSYDVAHVSYLNNLTPANDILQFLNLPTVGSLAQASKTAAVTIFSSSNPDLTIFVEKQTGETISQPSPNVVFVLNPKQGVHKLSFSAKHKGTYIINGWYSDENGNERNYTPISVAVDSEGIGPSASSM